MISITNGTSSFYMTLAEWGYELTDLKMRLDNEYTGRGFTFSLPTDESPSPMRYNKFTIFVGNTEDLDNSVIKMGPNDDGQWQYSVWSGTQSIETGRLLKK